MSLVDRVDSLATRIGQEFKTVRSQISQGGGGGGTQQVLVQANAPTVDAGVPYLWFQTGLGGGDAMTLWVEDGL